MHTPVVFYRTDLFEEAGITEFPKTWEEYEEAAKKLTKDDVYGTIIEAKQAGEPVTHLVDWFYQAGGSIIDADNNVTVNSPENAKAFNFMLKLMYEDESDYARDLSDMTMQMSIICLCRVRLPWLKTGHLYVCQARILNSQR